MEPIVFTQERDDYHDSFSQKFTNQLPDQIWDYLFDSLRPLLFWGWPSGRFRG
jgi:hypothetical protein